MGNDWEGQFSNCADRGKSTQGDHYDIQDYIVKHKIISINQHDFMRLTSYQITSWATMKMCVETWIQDFLKYSWSYTRGYDQSIK